MDYMLLRLAIIPGLIIIGYVYLKDKVEKEPVGLIAKLIVFGCLCCYVAGSVESIESSFLPAYPNGSLQYALTNAFLVAALCEEVIKYLALRLGSWKHNSFNYRFDGIVYGVSVAVGFAVLENIMYVSMYGFGTAVVRAFTAVPLHAFCGAIMGIFYSLSKKASIDHESGKCTMYTVMSVLVPIVVHGIYDTFAMLRSTTASMILIIFVVYLYITVIRTIKKMSAEDAAAGFYSYRGPIE